MAIKNRYSFILVVLSLLLVLSACGPEKTDEKEEINKQAMNAYNRFAIVHKAQQDDYFLYVSEGKIATIVKGNVTGVYEKRDEAFRAMIDDPETPENEAEFYDAMETPEDGLYICTRSRKDAAVLQAAKNAYTAYIVEDPGHINECLIFEKDGCFVPIKDGAVGSVETGMDAAMQFLFGENAASYKTEATGITGLYVCVKTE